MAFSLVLATLLLIGATQSTNLPQRIVGGEEAAIEDYPSTVAVESRSESGVWSQNCAGVLLTSRWIVSAAHCFDGKLYSPAARRVRAGSSIRNTGGQVNNVVRAQNHPTWGTLGLDGDITVVQLALAFDLTNPAIKPATLINQGFRLPDNYPVINAGWGTTSEEGESSEKLQEVSTFSINLDLCKSRYLNHDNQPLVVTDNMVCAGILDQGGKDACFGDAGGPLYFRDAGDNLFLYGLISWGYKCGDPKFPGVNTAVSSYVDWILKTAQ